MDSGESSLLTVAAILMVIGIFVSFIPIVPGPVLLWAIAIVTAFAEGFERLPVGSVVIISVLMILGSTNEYWLPILGVHVRGGSCWSALGALIGSILGTIFIPIPILGTLIGYVAGALLIELVRLREIRRAVGAGRAAFKMYLINYAVQVSISILIFVVFIASLWITGQRTV
jgi:uncharacterized protein YqgC (DUF456 family)